MIWSILTALATLVSMLAYIVTAFYIRAELKGLEKDRYIAVTSDLFSLWLSQDFMESQLWLLHRLDVRTWEEFIQAHRGDVGEIAFNRVGGFYDRVGTLVRLRLVNEKEILATMGGHAISVWNKIENLVKEARARENSTLFTDFENMLPSCYECYVPQLSASSPPPAPERSERKPGGPVTLAASSPPPAPAREAVPKITVPKLRERMEQGESFTLLDVRQKGHVQLDPRTLPDALVIPPDELGQRYTEIPTGRPVITYCA